ncbi:MAG: hypothetical protein IGR76_08625 [Synechococcales cyanobacterium T60_A2020_003]|nr:hypothetical protein [Synechococcales cyanobacterium T60_A2020_003]
MYTEASPHKNHGKQHKLSSSRISKNRNSEQFCRMAESGRIVRTYSGVLPKLERTARHILRCEHLDVIPGEGLSPYRAEPHYSHQIWIWYRLDHTPERLNLLFRGQFDFSSSEQDSNALAARVTDYLADLLINHDEHQHQLFLNESSWEFWTLAIDQFVSTEKSLLCLLDMIKNQQSHLDDGYLQIKAIKRLTHKLSSDLVRLLFANISTARKISRKDQTLLMEMLSDSELNKEHLDIINQLFDGIKKGCIKVVDH